VSSTAKTAAFAGGARYRPARSRTLSMSSGSGEILKFSVRHGCSPKDRQMRCTLAGEIPARRASSRLDQCVDLRVPLPGSVPPPPLPGLASVMVRGTPGRGPSCSPSSRLARSGAAAPEAPGPVRYSAPPVITQHQRRQPRIWHLPSTQHRNGPVTTA